MATIKARYYSGELVEWDRMIRFYRRETDQFEHKLAEVIQRNSIPNIAARVEEHQDKLNRIKKKFFRLRKQLQQQVIALKTDSTLIDDTSINTGTENQQEELRRNMQEAEKEYIDTKYDCYNFLSGTLKK